MQHTLTELERTSDQLAALPKHVTGKEPAAGIRPLRLYLCILRGVLLLTLTSVIFYNGVTIIHQNSKILGFFALNFDVPLPFLLIGLWSVIVLTLAILSVATLVKSYRLLSPLLRRSALARRTA